MSSYSPSPPTEYLVRYTRYILFGVWPLPHCLSPPFRVHVAAIPDFLPIPRYILHFHISLFAMLFPWNNFSFLPLNPCLVLETFNIPS